MDNRAQLSTVTYLNNGTEKEQKLTKVKRLLQKIEIGQTLHLLNVYRNKPSKNYEVLIIKDKQTIDNLTRKQLNKYVLEIHTIR